MLVLVKAAALTAVFLCFFLCFPFFVHADSVFDGYLPATSTAQSVSTLICCTDRVGQSFQTTQTHTITAFDMLISGTLGEQFTGYLFKVVNGQLQAVATSSAVGDYPGPLVAHFVFTTPYTAAPDNYIVAVRPSYNGFPQAIYGTRTGNPYNNGCVSLHFAVNDSGVNCDTTYDSAGSDAYFALYESAQSTGIQTIYSPTNYLSYATPIIEFMYDLYSAIPAVNSYGIQLVDLTAGQSVSTVSVTNNSSGSKTYDKSVTLTANHSYQWRAYLNTATGYVYSSYRYFNTGTTPGVTVSSSTILDLFNSFVNGSGSGSIIDNALNNGDFNNPNNSSSSAAAAIFSFSNIPSYYANRVPIGYVYDIFNIWNNVSTSTSEFAGLTIDFAHLNLPTSTRAWLPAKPVTFFSTTTVTSLLTQSQLDLLNGLASAAIAVTWAMMVFRRGTSLIKPV